MLIALSTPEWSWAILLSDVPDTASECCQPFHSPMELLCCATCSQFRADTVLSRRLDSPAGREPPEVSSNPNHSINMLSTPSVDDTSQNCRGDMGQRATGHPHWWLQRFCVLSAGKDVLAMAMTAVLYWPGLLCAIPVGTEMSRIFSTSIVKYFQAGFLQAMAFQIFLLQSCY